MNTVLFIWIGNNTPLYEWRTKCIRRAMEVYPDFNFKVITGLKSFFGFETIKLEPIFEAIKEYNVRPISDGHHMNFSDYARYYWLSNHPNTLYLDTDTWCIKRMPIIPGLGNMEYEAIWNGEDLESIKRVLGQHNNKEILLHTSRLLSQIGTNLSEYFEHKPLWSKRYSRPDLEIFNPD